MKTKEEKLWTALLIIFLIALFEAIFVVLSVGVINDLKATANGYESDRNLCRSQLDSLTQELERWQNDAES